MIKNAVPHPVTDLCRLIPSPVTQFHPQGSSQGWEGSAEPLRPWPGLAVSTMQEQHLPHLPSIAGDPRPPPGYWECSPKPRVTPQPFATPCSKPFSSSACTTHPRAGKRLLLCAGWISRSVHPLAAFPPCCESRLKSDCWEGGKVKV